MDDPVLNSINNGQHFHTDTGASLAVCSRVFVGSRVNAHTAIREPITNAILWGVKANLIDHFRGRRQDG